MVSKKIMLLTVSGVLVVFSACATVPRPVPRYFDAGNPLKVIALLPMKNDTTDVDGPNLVRQKMIQALEARSYIVKDVRETDQTLRDQMGINLGGQLEMTTPQKIGEVLGVAGLLYGTLMDFDETNTGVLSVRKVRAKFRLVQTGSGQVFWERGLGVRTETRMSGRSGALARAVARGTDARDKDVPWVTIDSTTMNERNVGKAFALGLGVKLLTKAIGVHLEHETNEMVKRVTQTLPWGPGPQAAAVAAAPAQPQTLKIKVPEPPAFGYIDYGRKDFSAVLATVITRKNSGETFSLDIPVAKAGEKIRMEMDMSRMAQGAEGMPPALSKVVNVHLGDKKSGYTVYPDARKYIVHSESGENRGFSEKPRIEKVRVGREMINSHRTDKYKVKITYKNGVVREGFLWSARDLGNMTIRSEIEDNDALVKSEIKDIIMKTPPSSLFEVPAGYTEAQGLMDLMEN